MAELPPAIGIDLGTTYSCVAVYRNGNVEVLANEEDNRVTPSCVSFTDTGVLLGDEAKIEMIVNPKNTIYDSKRLIGRHISDTTVINDMKMWPFEVVSEKNRLKIKVKYQKSDLSIYPEQVSSNILTKMKQIAEFRLKMKIKDAVITVPAYFNNAQRQATKDAGTIAGLNVLRIINEPTAAALAYGLDKTKSQNILIYDLGGGTFDVTIFKMDDGVFEVKSTTGDTHLGGQDFTNNLVKYCVEEIKKQQKDIVFDDTMLASLKSECEIVKRSLSCATKSIVNFNNQGKNISITITRACFEEINKQIFDRTLYYISKALMDAEMKKTDIDEVVLVGGSTRINKIQNILKEYFDGKNLNFTLNPDECVAHGAAIQAALITNCDPGNLKNIALLDVTPLSLGIKEGSGLMSIIIKRNSTMPIEKRHSYTTRKANQSRALIEIYEGERIMAEENKKLDEFVLENLPKDKAGLVKVEIIFNVDVDGILHVSAVEGTKSSTKSITVNPRFGCFSDIELMRMVEQSQNYNVDDLKRKELAEACDKLESLCHQIESDCTYNVHSISNSKKVIILEECYTVLSWLKDNHVENVEEYKERYKKLKTFYDNQIGL